jgi:hypothetical protein
LPLAGQGANGSKSISAGFGAAPPPPPKFTLAVKKVGTGTGFVGGSGIDCGQACSASLAKGARRSCWPWRTPAQRCSGGAAPSCATLTVA